MAFCYCSKISKPIRRVKVMLVRIWQKTIDIEKIRVFVFRQLENNYSYLIETRNSVIIIDPAEPEEIIQTIQDSNFELKAVLLTHYHRDHIQGVKKIIDAFTPQVVGPSGGEHEFPLSVVSNLEELIIGPFSLIVMETPGHTLNHLCYFFNDFKILFSGDMLFAAGCGKILEGSYQQMLESLKLMKTLPKETAVFFGHEYSIENLRFALSLEPERKEIEERIEAIASLDQYSVPTTLAFELEVNPYLRTDDMQFRKHLNMGNASEFDILIKLSQMQAGQE